MDTYQRLAVTKESSCVSNNHLAWDSEGRDQTRVGQVFQASYSAQYLGQLLFDVAPFCQHRLHPDNPLDRGGVSSSSSIFLQSPKFPLPASHKRLIGTV